MKSRIGKIIKKNIKKLFLIQSVGALICRKRLEQPIRSNENIQKEFSVKIIFFDDFFIISTLALDFKYLILWQFVEKLF